MSKLIKIGLPSKGRLKDECFNQAKNVSEILKENGFDNIESFNSNQVVFSHSREIVERLSENSLDIGISGYDLLKESLPGIQKNILVYSHLKFGFADLIVAVPDAWIDVQTIADLEEISFEFKDKNTGKLRVATKYPNLTNNFLISKCTPHKIVNSLGSTEIYPFTGSSEIITDITSSGATLETSLRCRFKRWRYFKLQIQYVTKSLRDNVKKKTIMGLLKKLI